MCCVCRESTTHTIMNGTMMIMAVDRIITIIKMMTMMITEIVITMVQDMMTTKKALQV